MHSQNLSLLLKRNLDYIGVLCCDAAGHSPSLAFQAALKAPWTTLVLTILQAKQKVICSKIGASHTLG
jgi:hypothetical protein